MKNRIKELFENRELIIKILIYTVSCIFVITLFKLQIVQGKEYREISEKKMLRSSVIEAPRGEIYDRNGVLLATNKLGYDLKLYKTKIDNTELNNMLKSVIDILEKNGDSIKTLLNIENGEFVFYSDYDKKKFYEAYDIDENMKTQDILEKLYKKYELTEYEDRYRLKILQVRYNIAINGYSLFKSIDLAEDISYESVIMIEEIKVDLPGVNIVVSPKRYYPNGTTLAHVLGYVGNITEEEYNELENKEKYTINSDYGKMGIENSMEKYLKGKDGILRTQVDSMGIANDEQVYEEPESGNNITLTIDYRLQKVAEDSLKTVIYQIKNGEGTFKKYEDSSSGSVVVLDVETSEVLAMANYPTFDPNEFVGGIEYSRWKEINSDKTNPMFNRAIAGTYSPGSTYKMLVGIAGLELGKITTDEKIQDTGIYPYGHNPKCWVYTSYRRTHGYINVSEAIKVSCNCYFYEVGRRIGIEEIVKYSKLFGLGTKTGVEIDGEKKGSIAGDNNSKEWYLGDTLSASIGQSYNSYTPVQLANYIATLSNGGKLNRVRLIRDVSDNKGKSESKENLLKYIEDYTGVKFEETDVNLKQENINAITEGMKTVTSEVGGTSYITFKNSKIEVAGKTGTAQVSSGSENALFVGFAPADKPKIAVVAVIEHGGNGVYTASVVRPIMDEYFNITQSEKTELINQSIVNSGIVY